MNSLQLISKTHDLWISLENSVRELQLEKKNPLEEAQLALMAADEAIRIVKSWTLTHDFDCWENEITFFKKLKPKFIGTFIYYSKVVSFFASLPNSGPKLKRKIYDVEFEVMQYFMLENKDFISYYRRNATYLDLKYFLRFKYDLDIKLAPDVHSYDDRFSSSHDHLVSHIIANDKYELFLKHQLHHLKKSHQEEEELIPKKLVWSAPKVALTELIVAMHQTQCFNGGNTDLSETIQWFESSFSIDLGNYHKTISEIRNRKANKTKFIQLLNTNLNTYLDSFDD